MNQELIKRLQESIADSLRFGKDMDAASWPNQEGILISGNEAQEIIDFYEAYTQSPQTSPYQRSAVRGLKDRKGRQVHEGDMVKVYDPVDRVEFDGEAFEVVWNATEYSWWLRHPNKPKDYSAPIGHIIRDHFSDDEKFQVEIQ